MIHELKASLSAPNLPFGVDLALPSLEAGARKTNHDYTHGQLDELVEVCVEEGARLFVSAVGVPPPSVVRRLHEGGVVVMNMVGALKHAIKAFEAGVDIVCAQGGEGGGHTGEVATGILVPACVDVARGYRPKMLLGKEGMVVAAGGIWDGRGLASALVMGAVGVWVGTRFVASEEAGCSGMHKEAVVGAGWGDTVRTLVITGRPLRVRRNEYIDGWEGRQAEIRDLTEKGVVPMQKDLEEGVDVDFPFLMGEVSSVIGDIKPARRIIKDMISEAVTVLRIGTDYIRSERGSKI